MSDEPTILLPVEVGKVVCFHCGDTRQPVLIPFRRTTGEPILAFMVVCQLCRAAAGNGDLTARLIPLVSVPEGESDVP